VFVVWSGIDRRALSGRTKRGNHLKHQSDFGGDAPYFSGKIDSAPSKNGPYAYAGRVPFLPPNQQRQSTGGLVK